MADQQLFAPGTSPFAGVENVKASNRSNFATEGHYIVRINSAKITKSERKGWFAVFTLQVLWTDPFSVKEWEGKGREPGKMPMAPMTEFNHLLKRADDSFLPNMKAIVMALFDAKEHEVTEDVMIQVTGPENPLAGRICEMRIKQITTRAGNPFTKHEYLRSVPAVELKGILEQTAEGKDVIERMYPQKALDHLIEAQAAQAAQDAADAAAAQAQPS